VYTVSAESYPKWKVLSRDFCNTSFPWLNFEISAPWILDRNDRFGRCLLILVWSLLVKLNPRKDTL